MNRNDLAIIATATAGTLVKVTLTDGTDWTVVSEGRLNSKGFVYRNHADEPTATFAPTKIESITPVGATDALPTGSPADVAPYFNMSAKELRVILRALGMGVGKGRRHVLDTADVRKVANHVANV